MTRVSILIFFIPIYTYSTTINCITIVSGTLGRCVGR
jgi:hypothetical protein